MDTKLPNPEEWKSLSGYYQPELTPPSSPMSGTFSTSGTWASSPYKMPEPEPVHGPAELSSILKPSVGLEETIKEVQAYLRKKKEDEEAESAERPSSISRFKAQIEDEEFAETLAVLAQRLAQFRDFLVDNGFSPTDASVLVEGLFDKVFMIGNR